jgi:protein SCO1
MQIRRNHPGARTSALRMLALLACVLAPSAAFAQLGPPPPPDLNPAGAKPRILQKVGIDQRIGQMLPLDASFKDESGADVRLGDFFGKRPVVLALAYYDCPMLCSQVLSAMAGALRPIAFDAGKEFDVIVISIDPRDTPKQAADKKKTYLARYGRLHTAAGWHFLTGQDPSIHAVADALGFRYAYDENIQQYAHGAAIYVATPAGEIARYFLGIEFPPRDLKFALMEASQERLGSVADQVVLLCYHYDPNTGSYSADTIMAVRIGFVLTVLAVLTFMFVSLRRERQANQDLATRY